MVYPPGSRATRGITVLVTDESGRPVPGVAVSFQLPEEGPSGVFINDSRTDIVTTQNEGRATVWGMRWHKTPGTVAVRITAMKDGVRAGMICTQYLDSASKAPSASIGQGHSKLLLISLAVATAAGVGLAAGALRNSKTNPTAAPVPTISIGTPTVIVGAP